MSVKREVCVCMCTNIYISENLHQYEYICLWILLPSIPGKNYDEGSISSRCDWMWHHSSISFLKPNILTECFHTINAVLITITQKCKLHWQLNQENVKNNCTFYKILCQVISVTRLDTDSLEIKTLTLDGTPPLLLFFCSWFHSWWESWRTWSCLVTLLSMTCLASVTPSCRWDLWPCV